MIVDCKKVGHEPKMRRHGINVKGWYIYFLLYVTFYYHMDQLTQGMIIMAVLKATKDIISTKIS